MCKPTKKRNSSLVIFLALLISACGGSGGGIGGDNEPASAMPDIEVGETGLTSTITEFGVTWRFSNQVQFGKFANQHYWIIGPVTITSASPAYNGTNNGLEVNPSNTSLQGYDSRIPGFDTSLNTPLPYTAGPGESVVKSVSVPAADTSCRPCLESASVLTVLSAVPPNNGAAVFRPPYFGSDKPLYAVEDLNHSLLPEFTPAGAAPGFEEVASQYRGIQLDHRNNWTGRYMHPEDFMPDYGSAIAKRNTEAAVTLMLQGSLEEKAQAVVNYVNNGIDIYHMVKGGVRWPAAGGHGEGRKLPAVMAAVLLEDTTMKDDLANVDPTVFGETNGVYFSAGADGGNGKVLWGQEGTGSENQYWMNQVYKNNARTVPDPYGQIDGGEIGAYQVCCTSRVWDNIVTALELMPTLKPVFNFSDLAVYTERWMTSGYHTQPDSCAPPVGICSGGTNDGSSCTTANEAGVCGSGACDLTDSATYTANFGITYGPDGAGGCIQDKDPSDGLGRFPQVHGTLPGEGFYQSPFVDAMKAAHL